MPEIRGIVVSEQTMKRLRRVLDNPELKTERVSLGVETVLIAGLDAIDDHGRLPIPTPQKVLL